MDIVKKINIPMIVLLINLTTIAKTLEYKIRVHICKYIVNLIFIIIYALL